MPKILKPEIKKQIRENNDLVKLISDLNGKCLFGSVYQMLNRNTPKLFNIDTITLISKTLGVPIDDLSMEVAEAEV